MNLLIRVITAALAVMLFAVIFVACSTTQPIRVSDGVIHEP